MAYTKFHTDLSDELGDETCGKTSALFVHARTEKLVLNLLLNILDKHRNRSCAIAQKLAPCLSQKLECNSRVVHVR
jgi:hypothetical protein